MRLLPTPPGYHELVVIEEADVSAAFSRRRRFNCAIMRKKLTPIFRQISDVATPKSVKKMAEMTVCAASQRLSNRLSKAYSGGFVGEVSAAETSYFVSSCCLQRSSDTSLHLSSQFKQCKWCLSWPCPARASNELGSSSWVSSWREVFCSLLGLPGTHSHFFALLRLHLPF